ncbi:MAG TPA: DUF1326 domain-containing protein [Chthoniobacterales bacterium]|nr:DUF1326 domain-containing protein [Chthoniobacterales bacterium]
MKSASWLLRLSLLLTITGISIYARVRAAEERKVPWKITGQLEEACSCNAACPCWFGSKPTKMTCGGGQVLFIERGTYGNVRLDGLAVANMAQSPAGKSMMESFGNWEFSTNYVDEKATPEQRRALEAIALTVLPSKNAAPQKFETKYVPITRRIEGKEHTITIGGVGEFRGHLLEGGLGGASKIINPPGADPLHHEYAQGQTTRMTYNDSGQQWNWDGSNYMLGTFSLDSEQYEKFTAGLAQKMAKAKSAQAEER